MCQAARVATDVLVVLTYLHNRQPPVLHRDIKPSNLMVGEGNRTYVVDFGAAQLQPAQIGTFTVVGTYGYTPMEQFGGRAVPASDIYSLGTTLVHLATGVSPADLPQRDLKIDFGDRAQLSLGLMMWLEKAIAPNVGDRHSSAQQAEISLQEIGDRRTSFAFKENQVQAPQRELGGNLSISDIPIEKWERFVIRDSWTEIRQNISKGRVFFKVCIYKIRDMETNVDKLFKFRYSIWQIPCVLMAVFVCCILFLQSEKSELLVRGFGYLMMMPETIFVFIALIGVVLFLFMCFESRLRHYHRKEIGISLNQERLSIYAIQDSRFELLYSVGASELVDFKLIGINKIRSGLNHYGLIWLKILPEDWNGMSFRIEASLLPEELEWIERNIKLGIEQARSQREQLRRINALCDRDK